MLTWSYNSLHQLHNARQPLLDLPVLLLNGLLGNQHGLQLLIWLLVGELDDAALQRLHLVLGTLPYGALSLAI